jgi:long-chain acyl-CoA synthetase
MTAASFWHRAETSPGATAVVTPDGVAVSTAELLERSHKIEAALARAGLRQGDHVAFLLPNGADIVAAALAVQRTGLYGTPLNCRLTAGEAEYILENSEARGLLASARFAGTAVDISGRFPDQARIAIDGPIPGFAALGAVAAGPAPGLDASRCGRLLLYTSGTTGTPSGVWRPLADQPAEIEASAESDRWYARFPPLPESHAGPHLVLGPMYHAQPLIIALHALQQGQALVTTDSWDSAQVLELIQRYRITSTAMVPTMFHRLLQLPAAARAGYDCSSLRRVIHAAAPCPVEIKRRMIEWWGPVLDEYYSATEGGGTALTSAEWLLKPGSVGRPYAGAHIVIVDETGAECGPREVGKVYLRLQAEFEYYKDPGKTSARRREGYFAVGDIGFLDEDGYLFLADRESDIIISGGVNIYPAEVEAVLMTHDAVADAAVIGVPDEEWGERVHAVVEPEPATLADAALGEELISYCRARLASFKCPRSVEFRASLPRLESGKLQRVKLREPHWAGRSVRI